MKIKKQKEALHQRQTKGYKLKLNFTEKTTNKKSLT